MGMKLNIRAICVLVFVVSVAEAQNGTVFDVTKYDAKADGQTDISQALTSAWKEACASTSPSKVVIPAGKYMLYQVSLAGPCKAPVNVQVIGTLQAPTDPSKFKADAGWVSFQYIDGLTLEGSGTFDGQGTTADCSKTGECGKLPINLRLNFVTNSMIRDITSLDSKGFHVNVLGCKNVTFQHVTITAAGNSVNTDGIHIGRSSGINITDTNIKTGDDCVSIGDGSQQITVTKVTCGPGHGISVGSLGKYPNEEAVIGITIMNCTLTDTLNGVRVKTWPSSPDGVASDMHFEDIIMNNVGNPVLIDQVYCPWGQCNTKAPSRVKISNVSFKNIRGTSATQVAVKIVCSQSIPCQNVEIGDINLTYNGIEGPASSQCENVKPTFSGKQDPPTCVKSA